MPAPEQFLTAVAMRTKQLRVGHSVVLTHPLFNHPVRVAERASVLDNLSGGRLEMGFGRSTPREWAIFHIDGDETRPRARGSSAPDAADLDAGQLPVRRRVLPGRADHDRAADAAEAAPAHVDRRRQRRVAEDGGQARRRRAQPDAAAPLLGAGEDAEDLPRGAEGADPGQPRSGQQAGWRVHLRLLRAHPGRGDQRRRLGSRGLVHEQGLRALRLRSRARGRGRLPLRPRPRGADRGDRALRRLPPAARSCSSSSTRSPCPARSSTRR